MCAFFCVQIRINLATLDKQIIGSKSAESNTLFALLQQCICRPGFALGWATYSGLVGISDLVIVLLYIAVSQETNYLNVSTSFILCILA